MSLGVSILIVVDVPLEVRKYSLFLFTSLYCFNPYCSGCTAGSFWYVASKKNIVSILFSGCTMEKQQIRCSVPPSFNPYCSGCTVGTYRRSRVLRFNPYCSGCTAGRIVSPHYHYYVSILIVVDVPLEVEYRDRLRVDSV